MEPIIILTSEMPSKGIHYTFDKITITNPGPEIAEPIVKPDTRPATTPRPDQDDPFYFPAPGVDPTPKG